MANEFRSLANLDMAQNRLLAAGLQEFSNSAAGLIRGQLGFGDYNVPIGRDAADRLFGPMITFGSASDWARIVFAQKDDTISGYWTFNPATAGPPFAILLTGNAKFNPAAITQNLVADLNADYLDGYNSSQNVVLNTVAVRYTDGRLRVGGPVESSDAVTKAYADNLSSGNRPIAPVRVATNATLAGSYSSATDSITASTNGPPSIHATASFDGVTLVVNDRILFKDQSPTFGNGVYFLQTAGTGVHPAGTPCVFKRTTDADEASEVTVGATVNVLEGTANRGNKYRQSQTVANIDTDPEIWVLDSTTNLIQGPGIIVTGNKISFLSENGYQPNALFVTGPAPAPTTTINQLGPGTNNQVLTVIGGTPAWANAQTTTLPTLEHESLTPSMLTISPTGGHVGSKKWQYTVLPAGIMQLASPSKQVDFGTYTFPADGGTLTTALRSDVQLRINPAITPTWTELHTFSGLTGGISTVAPILDVPTHFATFSSAPTGSSVQVRSTTLAKAGEALKVPAPAAPTKTVKLTAVQGTLTAGIQYLPFDTQLALDESIVPNWTGAHTWVDDTATDKVILTKVSAGASYSRLSIDIAGKHAWGSGSDVEDTFLYRSAAGELRLESLSAGQARFFTDKLTTGAATAGAWTHVGVWTGTPATVPSEIQSVSKAQFIADLGLPSLDGIDFTNDPAAAEAGRVRFSSAVVAQNWAESTITGGTIGTGDYSVHIRCRWPSSAPSNTAGLWTITTASTAGSAARDLGAFVGSGTTTLNIYGRDDAGAMLGSSSIVMTKWLGRIVDIVVTRTGGTENCYINGEIQTYTRSPNAGASINVDPWRFRVGGMHNATLPFPETIYRARLFNRALSQADVIDLCRHGVRRQDRWGTVSPVVAGCLIDLDLGAATGTTAPDLSFRYGATLYGTYDKLQGHLHEPISVVGAPLAVPYFSSSGRMIADPAAMSWTGVTLSVYGQASIQSTLAAGASVVGNAWLEAAPGTTSKAPLRLGVGAFMSTITSGSIENDGVRPWYSTSALQRRGLAFYDELNFTNDFSAEPGGAVCFGMKDVVTARLWDGTTDKEIIGTSPASVWVRFLVPLSGSGNGVRGPNGIDCLWSLNDGISAWNNAWSTDFVGATTGTLEVMTSTNGSNYRLLQFTNFFIKYGGKVVDLVITRDGTNTANKVYVNGVLETPTSNSPGGTDPGFGMSIQSKYFAVGCHHQTYGTVTRIHRAVVFNRELSQQDVKDLSLHGLNEYDQWGSQVPYYQSNFTADTNGWSAIADATSEFNQTVAGSPGWLKYTKTGTGTPRMDANRAANLNTNTIPHRRWRVTFDFNLVAGTMPSLGFTLGGYASGPGGVGVTTKATAAVGVTSSLFFDGFRDANGAVAWRIEPQTQAAGNPTAAAIPMPVGTIYAIKNYVATRIGAVIDLDLGIGCGSAIPDRSGRYHGALNATVPPALQTWSHFVNKCPPTVPSGPGDRTIGLRRYVQKGVTLATPSVTITHSLATRYVTVQCWQDDIAIPQKFEVGVTAETDDTIKIWPNTFPGGAKATVVVIG